VTLYDYCHDSGHGERRHASLRAAARARGAAREAGTGWKEDRGGENGEIVPRSAHGSTLVLDGDRLEIVVAVGGG